MTGFWRSLATVVTGTAIAQVIPILGSVVIARVYAPAEFGIFSAWLGLMLLLAVVITGRFEAALAIEEDGEPRRLGVLTTLLTACIGAIVAIAGVSLIVLAAPDRFSHMPTTLIIAFVPAALVMAVMQIWQSWAAAEGSYRKLSIMRITQASAITVAQIGAGMLYASATSLVLAYLLGAAVALVVSLFIMPMGGFPAAQKIATVRRFWKNHRRFPQFSLPADAINAAAAQLPVLIVAQRFGTETAGLLAMAMRILGAPIGLLGKAVLDVFKRQASASYRERGECQQDYLQTFKILALMSLIFCSGMWVFGESLFALAFGDKWRGAGVIAVWLLPLFALRFIASPLSYTVYIAGKQHIDLFWQAALLLTTYISLSLPQTHRLALILYCAGYSSLYIIYLIMSYQFSKGANKSAARNNF